MELIKSVKKTWGFELAQEVLKYLRLLSRTESSDNEVANNTLI